MYEAVVNMPAFTSDIISRENDLKTDTLFPIKDKDFLIVLINLAVDISKNIFTNGFLTMLANLLAKDFM
jgi:hypothetical protein